MEKPTVGTPYLSGGTYAVVITWTAPSQTGSSAIESYEINQAYYSETKTWTVSGTTLSTTADSLVGSRHYAFRVRAINEDGRKGPWSDILPVPIPSVPVTTTTTTLPPPTTTFQIASTTTSAPARYKLDEFKGKNYRWDPCDGQIRMKLNHGGRLDSTQLNEWETELVSLASGIAAATGLDFVYAGTTTQELATEHPGEGRHNADILIYIGPMGTGLLEGQDSSGGNWIGKGWLNGWTSGVWDEQYMEEIQVSTSYATASYMWPYGKKYLMNWLGKSFGLASIEDGIDTEIMSWGSNGSGTLDDPQWGTGDLIGFGLVGANGGCVN
jgi:hypothetical protein